MPENTYTVEIETHASTLEEAQELREAIVKILAGAFRPDEISILTNH